MAEIIKVYKQKVPALRFIGKKYGHDDRVDGNFGKYWGDFFKNSWFHVLETLVSDTKEIYEDGDAYIGLMRCKEGEPFEYRIGMFMPPDTNVPEGFEAVDFDAGNFGICWLYGTESEVFMLEDKCADKLEEEKHEILRDKNGATWFFERYGCPRYTTPDNKGNIILDIGFYVK